VQAALAAGQDPRYASPGVLGFLVVFLLALATWLLIRSMTGHLRKVRYHAEAQEREAAAVAAAAAAEKQPPAATGKQPTATAKPPTTKKKPTTKQPPTP